MTVQLKNKFTCPQEHGAEITGSIWRSSLRAQEHFRFFHRLLQGTLQALQTRSYTAFDAQTTSNCCHGLSVLARRLILSLLPQLDRLTSLVNTVPSPELIDHLPSALIDLTSLHVLTLIIELDPERGRRTHPQKLKSLAPLGTAFCEKIVKKLQRQISTTVAEGYSELPTTSCFDAWLGSSKIDDWKKFVEEKYLRMDRKGIKYASCMFSMQVVLSHLLLDNAKIALVNDIINTSDGNLITRYGKLFENNENAFREIDDYSHISPEEPIIVFGGYALTEEKDGRSIEVRLTPWIYQLRSLILACDMHYPQFPVVRDDPAFTSDPIATNDPLIFDVMKSHAKIKGVSAEDPSLFCLSHIFVASFESVSSIISKDDLSSLPSCYLPFTS